MESAPKSHNKLIDLEGGTFFNSAYTLHGSEKMKLKTLNKQWVLQNIFNYYANEWIQNVRGTENTQQLSAEEVSVMNEYISSIPPEQILEILTNWQEDWGAAEYEKQDAETKLAIDAADDLISEISIW